MLTYLSSMALLLH